MVEMERLIEVRCLDGQSTKVSISPNCSIADLKASLKESFIAAKKSPNFHLFFKGSKLRLESRIDSVSIDNGEFLVLVPFAKKTQVVSPRNDHPEEINTQSAATEQGMMHEASHSAWKEIMNDLSSISEILPDDSIKTSFGALNNAGSSKNEGLKSESSGKDSFKRRKKDTVMNSTLWDIFSSKSKNVFDRETCGKVLQLVESVNCLSDSQSGKCLLFEGSVKITVKMEKCSCQFWLKKVLKTFTLLNIMYAFCQMAQKCMTLSVLEEELKHASIFGLDDLCISDVENLSRLCPKVVVILGKEERMFAKSTFAIIISDSLTFLVDKPKLAVRPRAGRKPAVVSTSTIVNAVERRELLFKTDLWMTIKIYMEKTQSDTGIPLCCSLQDLLTYADSHVDILKNSEVNLVKNRALASRCCEQTRLGPIEMIDHLRKGIGMRGQMVHVEKIDAKLPAYADFPDVLSENSKAALQSLGFSRLYSHQSEAIHASVTGKNVVVATSTSSGKSLCYNLPVVEHLSQNTSSCALYIFPTKALAQDQLRALLEMTRTLSVSFNIGIYDGDTSQEHRIWIRDNARLLITNPDMLHMSILPYHRQFQRILINLRFVVIDETHMYKGAFGCHTALILRRLRRICSHVHGSDPSFIFCTATSANPREHAMGLANLRTLELVQNDGSPSGPKYFVLWNPPLTVMKGSKNHNKSNHGSPHGEALTTRSSPILEISYLFAEMVQHGLRCITFCKTRKLSELVLCYTREILQVTAPALAGTICAYRGGYNPQDRRKIESDLFGGKLRGVAATNALELGIDVGHIDATLHLGFPGSIASLWQQAGRSGRRGRSSLAIYVAFEGPLDQYFMRFPNKLFQHPVEHVLVDADNEKVLEQHIACAALELPLCLEHDEYHFGSHLNNAIMNLKNKGSLVISPENLWSYIGPEEKPSRAFSIRMIESEKYKVVEKLSNEILEEIEDSRAFFQVYEGAVYMHQGKTYMVEALDLSLKVAFCLKADLKYFTKTRDYTDIHVIGGNLAYPQVKTTEPEQMATTAQANTCTVTTKWFGFYRIWRASNQIFDSVELNLPSFSYESQAVWIRVPPSIRKAVDIQKLSFRAGQHAASHALLNVVPLYLMCNASDLRSECANPHETRKIPERILLYDQHPGGIGIAKKVQLLFRELLTASLELVTACSCSTNAGCPSCIQTLSCSEYNEVLDKKAAIIILKGVLQAETESLASNPTKS
ncbi:DNA helicase protein [Dioscorea alata]|uniref:DNA helicase protein n=2 Tax=Dioscorea alata TaxID=55571 RepID=A0ACB7UWC0_DIOAL|nr:DNA helicase protein [Dioscorea alata]